MATHYRNTPNDLQLLGDAPAHRLFVLLGSSRYTEDQNIAHSRIPSSKSMKSSQSTPEDTNALPDVLVAIQVAFEGSFRSDVFEASLASGEHTPGDLIPWTLAQQFCPSDFPKLAGIRIVRIVAHPEVHGMGYGSRALELLVEFLEKGQGSTGGIERVPSESTRSSWALALSNGCVRSLQDEIVRTDVALPPLLIPLHRVEAPRMDWIGTSFGLSRRLLQFWACNGFRMVYVRQSRNHLTGEHNVILLRELRSHVITGEGKASGVEPGWSEHLVTDMRRRFVRLLASPCFEDLDLSVCLCLLGKVRMKSGFNECSSFKRNADEGSGTSPESIHSTAINDAVCCSACANAVIHTNPMITGTLASEDRRRLRLYVQGIRDHHTVADVITVLAECVFTGCVPCLHMTELQFAVLLGLGLQRRDIESVSAEMNLTPAHTLALLSKLSRKFLNCIDSVIECRSLNSVES